MDAAPSRQAVFSFQKDYEALRMDGDLHIIYNRPEDGAVILVATVPDANNYVADALPDGTLAVYKVEAPVRDADHVVIGRTVGPLTAKAMSGKGDGITPSKLQAANEAFRRGEKPAQPVDRNAKAGAIQRAGEALRARVWGQ